MSLAGSGYLSGNMLVPFPFEDGQCIPLSDQSLSAEAQIRLNRCFVDASFCSDRTSMSQSEWPSIGRIDYVYDKYRPLMSIGFYIHAFGHDFRVSVAAGDDPFPIIHGEAPWGTYVVTMSSEGIRDFCRFGEGYGLRSPLVLSPPATGCSSPSWQDGVFWFRVCAKCITLRQSSLSSIIVYDGVSPSEFGTSGRGYSVGDVCWRNGFRRCVSEVDPGSQWNESDWEPVGLEEVTPSFTLSGSITMKPGNNMVIAEEEDNDNSVELVAEPGAGLGVVPCTCDDTKTPWAILMAGPDGHMRIFNDTCYDLEPSTTSGVLKMHAKCTACCTCDMYESIVNDKLNGIADAIRTARNTINGFNDLYKDSVSRFNSRISRPKKADISLTLTGVPIGSKVSSSLKNSKVKGKMHRCAFTAIVRNSSFFKVSIGGVKISGTNTIVEAAASWSNQSGSPLSVSGDTAGAVSRSYTLYPGRSLVITFVSAKNTMVSKVKTGGYSGSISVSAYYNGGLIGTYKQTVSV